MNNYHTPLEAQLLRENEILKAKLAHISRTEGDKPRFEFKTGGGLLDVPVVNYSSISRELFCVASAEYEMPSPDNNLRHGILAKVYHDHPNRSIAKECSLYLSDTLPHYAKIGACYELSKMVLHEMRKWVENE